jgi:hypothetical protein
VTLQQAIKYRAQALELSEQDECDASYCYFLLKNAHALETLCGDCWDEKQSPLSPNRKPFASE